MAWAIRLGISSEFRPHPHELVRFKSIKIQPHVDATSLRDLQKHAPAEQTFSTNDHLGTPAISPNIHLGTPL